MLDYPILDFPTSVYPTLENPTQLNKDFVNRYRLKIEYEITVYLVKNRKLMYNFGIILIL